MIVIIFATWLVVSVAVGLTLAAIGAARDSLRHFRRRKAEARSLTPSRPRYLHFLFSNKIEKERG